MPFSKRRVARRRLKAAPSGGSRVHWDALTDRRGNLLPSMPALIFGYGSVLDLSGAGGFHNLLATYYNDSRAEDDLRSDWACVGADYIAAITRMYHDLNTEQASQVPNPEQLMFPLCDHPSPPWYVIEGDQAAPTQSHQPQA